MSYEEKEKRKEKEKRNSSTNGKKEVQEKRWTNDKETFQRWYEKENGRVAKVEKEMSTETI